MASRRPRSMPRVPGPTCARACAPVVRAVIRPPSATIASQPDPTPSGDHSRALVSTSDAVMAASRLLLTASPHLVCRRAWPINWRGPLPEGARVTSIRLLGLDIGGTSSRARVMVDGAVVAEAQAASASLTAAGLDSAAAALGGLLGQPPL